MAEGLDGRPAGIARGRADDGDGLAALVEHPVHETGEELHRHVLEGQGGTVKQLQQPLIGIELAQGGDGGMEALIGFGDHGAKSVIRQAAGNEGRHDLKCYIGIRVAGKRLPVGRRQARPRLGNIEAAITGKTGEQKSAKPSAGALPRVDT